MTDTTPIAFSSCTFHKKLKPELQTIATAVGLNADATVPAVQKSIQKYMCDHSELADDRRFVPFYAHRTAPKAAGNDT